ncbi:hypothetical protein AB0I69_37585 [Streptomyces sp. NPDC050508]|uniref:hypothetical protein n=1 Tax=Streptomyces sp. NPDC050508 TaxID=3155405 RepID=UPI003446CCA6
MTTTFSLKNSVTEFTVDASIVSRLQNAGLEVISSFAGTEGPSAEQAFQRVVHIDAKPAQRITISAANSALQVNSSWRSQALSAGVISDDGSFLVAVGLKHPWVQVRLTETTDISALDGAADELLFVARSITGHRVCAATTEEGEYWILVLDFPQP